MAFKGIYDIQEKTFTLIWDKVFKNGPSKFCVRQPLKIF